MENCTEVKSAKPNHARLANEIDALEGEINLAMGLLEKIAGASVADGPKEDVSDNLCLQDLLTDGGPELGRKRSRLRDALNEIEMALGLGSTSRGL